MMITKEKLQADLEAAQKDYAENQQVLQQATQREFAIQGAIMALTRLIAKCDVPEEAPKETFGAEA